MRHNHLPYWVFAIKRWLTESYTRVFLAPQFDSIGADFAALSPRHVTLFGQGIHAGDNLHIISSPSKPVNFSCWQSKQQQGEIIIGNNVLISPGVSIAAADAIHIGDNCMIAAECYISDCDWHGIYNRTRPFRCSAAITLEENVWLGYRAVIGKGVSIGKNSIVAAGAVVVNSVAPNTIVGGNPATIIGQIDPKRRMLTRDFLFQPHTHYDTNQALVHRYALANNTTWKWLKSVFRPTPND